MNEKKRIQRYLEKQYSNLSQDQQKNKLEQVLERLRGVNFLDDETLREVVQQLLDEEGWSMSRVLAHLDLIDLDERT